MMTTFWRNWLVIWCIGLALFGLALYGAAYPATTGPARMLFALFGNPLPPEPDRYLRFAVPLMGAVSLGWALTMLAALRLAWTAEPDAGTALWKRVTVAMLVWYVLDSAASVATGFPINALSNTALLVAYLVPVVASGVLTTVTARTEPTARPQVG
jgi:hypothetical protein